MIGGVSRLGNLRVCHRSVCLAHRDPRRTRRLWTACTSASIDDVYLDQVKGKNFHCTQCGKCCTGTGEVWIEEADVQRLANKVHIQRELFLSRYVKGYSGKPGYWLLRNTNGTQDCIFLRGTECIVNDAKPLQCRTYPFWPDLMEPEAWQAERSEMCEGLDHPEACELEIEQAALQLKASTEFFTRRDSARQK